MTGVLISGCQGLPFTTHPSASDNPLEAVWTAPLAAGGARFEVGTHDGVPWPIVPPPIEGPLPPAPVPSELPPAPPTRAGARVVAVLDEIQASLIESSYQHSTKVRARDGVYHWDCSGMTAWILRRSAPTALRAIKSERPVARDFFRVIAAAPDDRARGGWQRIPRIADVMPGDVFAWRKPPGLPSKNTGHVGFVVDRPLAVPGLPGAWAVRIADSSSFSHQNDSRDNDVDGGFGIGTIAFLVDDDGRGTHYGWYGTQSDRYVVTPIVFGRVTR